MLYVEALTFIWEWLATYKLQTSAEHIKAKTNTVTYSVTHWFYSWRCKKAWIGSRKFCNQITRKQLLVNTKVKEHSVDTEQNGRGMTGDFLTPVTKDQRHEYLTCCYQMKSVKVWQISLKLDEQSLFKSRILQCQLSSNDSYSQDYNCHLDHCNWSCDCFNMKTPVSPNIKSTFQWASYIIDINNELKYSDPLRPLDWDHCYLHLIHGRPTCTGTGYCVSTLKRPDM